MNSNSDKGVKSESYSISERFRELFIRPRHYEIEYAEPILSARDKVDSSGVMVDSIPISDEQCAGLRNVTE